MPVRPIVLYPDPRLQTACPPVTTIDSTVHALLRDLLDTMDNAPPRTVGIAAPQVGTLLRATIIDTSRNPRYPSGHGLLSLINPVITAHDGEQFFREGCLSLPDYTANIRRWQSITVDALDINGSALQINAEGFEAVVLQHEIDHLDGLLFLDRVTNIKTDLFRRGTGRPNRE